MDIKRVTYRILLGVAAIVLVWLCVNSIVTPIQFEQERVNRETSVIKNLISLRTAEAEYKLVTGQYTDNLDSLIIFLRTTPKKDVYKIGSLTDKQLEDGLTEVKAVKILENALLKARIKQGIDDLDELYAYIWENDRTIKENSLQGFRRDTIETNMIEALYKGEYDEESIGDIIYIPYTNGQKYEVEVNNNYTTSQGINVPLVEIRAHYDSYLADLNEQERINLIDKERKLEHYPGLKVGDITQPNNNGGNWE